MLVSNTALVYLHAFFEIHLHVVGMFWAALRAALSSLVQSLAFRNGTFPVSERAGAGHRISDVTEAYALTVTSSTGTAQPNH